MKKSISITFVLLSNFIDNVVNLQQRKECIFCVCKQTVNSARSFLFALDRQKLFFHHSTSGAHIQPQNFNQSHRDNIVHMPLLQVRVIINLFRLVLKRPSHVEHSPKKKILIYFFALMSHTFMYFMAASTRCCSSIIDIK